MPDNVTELLGQIRKGNREAESALMDLVYAELRRLAHRFVSRERTPNSVETTGLVHEAYLRLAGPSNVDWQSRAHFFAVAARVMRRILVDAARQRRAYKRGGDQEKVTIDERVMGDGLAPEELLALNDALDRLAAVDPRQAHIVELRFFCGLTEDEIARQLQISTRTVKREWSVARAWLHGELH
ncbi:MAG: sigma-70 family RNA polymerase sigma factor [Bryobacteraceae bacterium]